LRERPVIGRCDLNAVTLIPKEKNV